MIDLKGSPYLIEGVASENLARDLQELQERVEALRRDRRLTPETLELYYGEKRFEQVAESNAIEGSTLSVGETELAVLKGVTITGHDPRYARDAQQLDKALRRMRELARGPKPTDIAQVKEIHEIILGGGPGAGNFRTQEGRIGGSKHRPPRTWQEVMRDMEAWEAWSQSNPSLFPVIRSAVLHAWLTHIHPFLDGNGRTARAIGNLELIRAGYPPIIIKKTKHRERYLDALLESDEGNLASFLDLVLVRVDDALRDLERAAASAEGYDKAYALIRKKQENRLAVWNAAVDLLVSLITSEIESSVEPSRGRVVIHRYRDSLTLDDFIALCEGKAVRDSWSFRVHCSVPGLQEVVRLAWLGYRTREMQALLPAEAPRGPSIFWSVRNDEGYPPWKRADSNSSPAGEELTLIGDTWHVFRGGQVRRFPPSKLAAQIAEDLVAALS